MTFPIEILGLRCAPENMAPANRAFRPPSWPPPGDWVVCESPKGEVISRWKDPVWDISHWHGRSMILDFGDGRRRSKVTPIDSENAYLLRLLTTWRIWGVRASSAPNSIKGEFLRIRRVVAYCSQNNILASDLARFPKVLDNLLLEIPPSEFQGMYILFHRLLDAREYLGFVVLDEAGLQRLAEAAPPHESRQTPYIPPRIWSYQLSRLKHCLEDYLAHERRIEECVRHYFDFYIRMRNLPPLKRPRSPYYLSERFSDNERKYGIHDLLERWIGRDAERRDIRSLSGYLTLVQYVGLAYTANFSLQRAQEVATLRADCLIWDQDETLGRIPMLVGETTKTDADSDARWCVSPSVEIAIRAMSSVARLRLRCSSGEASSEDSKNPYLLTGAKELWAPNQTSDFLRPCVRSYGTLCGTYEKLFDADELRITEEDLRLAKMVTPSIREEDGFSVGRVWPFTWHQLRRTGAVNMFFSNDISDSSIQFQLKHSTRVMPLYYGRGYAKLQLNEDVETSLLTAMYEVMTLKVRAALTNRYVSPLGSQRKETLVVNLVGLKDATQLAAASKRGELHFRETRVGACTHRGFCSYGGVESISRCTGGDGMGPCADALFDREKAGSVRQELQHVEKALLALPTGSPRHSALLAERQGMENFLNAVKY